MTEWYARQAWAFGLLVFAALLLILAPELVWPVGLTMGVTICYTQVRVEFIVARERSRIDKEHEAL